LYLAFLVLAGFFTIDVTFFTHDNRTILMVACLVFKAWGRLQSVWQCPTYCEYNDGVRIAFKQITV